MLEGLLTPWIPRTIDPGGVTYSMDTEDHRSWRGYLLHGY